MKAIKKQTQQFTEFEDGSIEFTEYGRDIMSPVFANQGVCIEDVKTKAQADALVDKAAADAFDEE